MLEHTVDPHDLTTALWRFCNNLDPKRDHILFQRPLSGEDSKFSACMGLDGTRKQRRWMTFIATGRIIVQTRRRLIPLTKMEFFGNRSMDTIAFIEISGTTVRQEAVAEIS